MLVHRCQSTSGNSSRTAALMSAKAGSEAGAFPWGQKDCTKLEKQTRLPDLAIVCEGMIVDLPFCRFGQGLLATFHVVNTIHWKVPCRTRAAHVQHTCNTTTLPVNLRSKCLSGNFRRPKAISKGKENILHPCAKIKGICSKNARVARRVARTCVARWLHVFSQVFPLRPQKSLAGSTFSEPGVELSWQAQDFEWQAQHFRAVKAGVGNFGRQAQCVFCVCVRTL